MVAFSFYGNPKKFLPIIGTTKFFCTKLNQKTQSLNNTTTTTTMDGIYMGDGVYLSVDGSGQAFYTNDAGCVGTIMPGDVVASSCGGTTMFK